MIEIENSAVFGEVIAEALKTVDANSGIQTWEKIRAVNAIAKAAARMQDPAFAYWMEFNGDADEMLIWNSRSNCIYTVKDACQCMAAQNGVICWHRAAKRLYELYLAAVIGPVTVIRVDCSMLEEVTA
jgi:hypothetical protein